MSGQPKVNILLPPSETESSRLSSEGEFGSGGKQASDTGTSSTSRSRSVTPPPPKRARANRHAARPPNLAATAPQMMPFMVPFPIAQWPQHAAMQGLPGYDNKYTQRRKNERSYKKLIRRIRKDPEDHEQTMGRGQHTEHVQRPYDPTPPKEHHLGAYGMRPPDQHRMAVHSPYQHHVFQSQGIERPGALVHMQPVQPAQDPNRRYAACARHVRDDHRHRGPRSEGKAPRK